MKKIICLLLLFTTLSLSCEDITAEPYTDDEFHPILQDVRRASIIFCGAFPLGYMYSTIIMDPIFDATGIYDDLDSSEQSNKEIEMKLISSLVFSGIVMLIDLIIEKFYRGN